MRSQHCGGETSRSGLLARLQTGPRDARWMISPNAMRLSVVEGDSDGVAVLVSISTSSVYTTGVPGNR